MGHGLVKGEKLAVALLTGGHPYDVPGFTALVQSLAGVEVYVQDIENLATDVGQVHEQYDVLWFYDWPRVTPAVGSKVRTLLESLGSTPQGILVHHHALVSYLEWDWWGKVVGMAERKLGWDMGQRYEVKILNTEHPITRGLEAWELVDETYDIGRPGPDCAPLLGAEHPKSMPVVGWTRQFGQARVFCFQPGHDNEAYANPHFRAVVARGLQWCARRS